VDEKPSARTTKPSQSQGRASFRILKRVFGFTSALSWHLENHSGCAAFALVNLYHTATVGPQGRSVSEAQNGLRDQKTSSTRLLRQKTDLKSEIICARVGAVKSRTCAEVP